MDCLAKKMEEQGLPWMFNKVVVAQSEKNKN